MHKRIALWAHKNQGKANMRIRARKLTKGSLLKIIFIVNCIILLPFTLLCGIASIFGAHTVTVNDRPVTGTTGFVASLVLGPFFCIFFSAILWVISAIGLWIYSLLSPIELEFVDAKVISPQPSGETESAQQVEPQTP